jgi:hypothetical protein
MNLSLCLAEALLKKLVTGPNPGLASIKGASLFSLNEKLFRFKNAYT